MRQSPIALGAAAVILCTLLATRGAAAQDDCLAEYKQLNQIKKNNEARLNTPSDVCPYTRADILLQNKYAAFYRRCPGGYEGEKMAVAAEEKASNNEFVLRMSCRGR
jgi:hypothetical protein